MLDNILPLSSNQNESSEEPIKTKNNRPCKTKNWIASVKAEGGHEYEILEKALQELRKIREEKNKIDIGAEQCCNDMKEYCQPIDINIIKSVFKAGVKWQKEQTQIKTMED